MINNQDSKNIVLIDIEKAVNIVWDALMNYRASVIPEGGKQNDEAWGEICTAMADIQDCLGVEENYDCN